MDGAYQTLLNETRLLAEASRPWTPKVFVDRLSCACLHAEVHEWAEAMVELERAEASAPRELRSSLVALRRALRLRLARALGAAYALTAPLTWTFDYLCWAV